MNECLSPLSTTPAISCSAVSTTPAKKLSPVLLTPVINPCLGFSVIAGVVDTSDADDTGQLSPVTTTPAINLLPVKKQGRHGGGELARIGES